VGVISVVSIVIAQSFFTTTRSSVKVEITKDAKQSGSFAISVMERMIRNAERIMSPCTAGGVSDSSLSLVNPDGDTTTFRCDFADGASRIASASAAQTEYLTADNLTLGGLDCSDPEMTLNFVCTASGLTPARVAISFILAQKNSSPDIIDQASVQFQTTVNVRNID
jgi:hypothetical protein